MKRFGFLLLALFLIASAGPARAEWRVTGGTRILDVGYPESAAFDPDGRSVLVSLFGRDPNPLRKDGEGSITRMDLEGASLEIRFLPAAPQDALHKPKGLWVDGRRLWTTDIDAVWVFDTQTRQGRRVVLPGARFANDVTLAGDRIYVSDTEGQTVFVIQPADFLTAEPTVSVAVSRDGLFPNGLAAVADGSILIGSSPPGDEPGSIYRLSPAGLSKITPPLGRIDGLAVLPGGAILFTDWTSGSLKIYSADGQVRTLEDGFKGPADFGLFPSGDGFLVAAPDLVAGELRILTLER